jgi:hypothetical protein
VNIRNYILVTGAYWGFTLTDGALRMLVLLHFFNLGYSPVTLAFLFLLYEFFGIVTNLLGRLDRVADGVARHAGRGPRPAGRGARDAGTAQSGLVGSSPRSHG